MQFNESVIYTLFCVSKLSDYPHFELVIRLSDQRLIDNAKKFYEYGARDNVLLSAFSKLFVDYDYPEIIEPTSPSWPLTFAPYIWTWIHFITRDLDLKFTNQSDVFIKIKVKFILLIESMIGCSECAHHYKLHRQELIDATNNESLFNVFMAFHTFVNKNRGASHRGKFIFNKKLINRDAMLKFI